MVTAEAVLLAILALPAPMRAPEGQAERYACAIASVAESTEEAAALVVIAARESTFRREVEDCRVAGLGGMGAFGLSDRNGRAAQCGPLYRQAKAARDRYVARLDWAHPTLSFGRYIGAVRHWQEAHERAVLYWRALWEIENLACL
jgi:hypothetical protein